LSSATKVAIGSVHVKQKTANSEPIGRKTCEEIDSYITNSQLLEIVEDEMAGAGK